MFPLKKLNIALIILPLAACSGSNGPAVPVVNTAEATIAVDESVVSFAATGVDVALPIATLYDRGTFVAGSDTDGVGSGQIIAVSETDNTFAVYLLTRDDGATSQSFIGRTTEQENLPSGQATLTGTYVGSFVNEESDNLRAYITGDTTVDVDFDAMTISGRVENRTSDLFGLGLEFVLGNEWATIELTETAILRDGSFAGGAERIVPNEDTEDTSVSTEAISFAGLIGGTSVDETEVVGTIEVNRTTTGISQNGTVEAFGLETGVFVAGH